jgi:hypothetical protein
VFFVVTKVDICPAHVLQHSLATLAGILRKPGVKKKPFTVRAAHSHCRKLVLAGFDSPRAHARLYAHALMPTAGGHL